MSNQNNPPSVAAIMVALYNFDAEDEPEISMKKGDQIEMLDMDPALNGWAYARKKRDGLEGYVPISYLGTNNNSSARRSHKHSKVVNQSRSTSPNPNKGRYDDKNNTNNPNSYNRNSYHNRSNYNNQHHQNAPNNNHNQQNDHNQSHQHQHHQQQQQQQSINQNVMNTSNNNNNKGGNNNNPSSSSSNNNASNQQHGTQQNEVPDAKQIICSFHRDFIPDMNDLYKYFGEFGKITNKLEIEYDSKKVPLAKIKFQSASCVEKVCDKGNRQQIPSGSQNGTIHIRVYRSMQDYINNTQRSNRGPYNKHKNSRRGGF